MSETGVAAVRWRLPARRKRFIAIVAPSVFVVMLLAFGLFGDWRSGLGLAVSFAGLTVMLSGIAVRLDSGAGAPDPRRISASRHERKRIRTVVRHHLTIEADEAERLRPVVEQIGRSSARGVWAATGLLIYVVGNLLSGLGERLEWTTPLRLIVIAMALIALALVRRDLRICREFMDRY